MAEVDYSTSPNFNYWVTFEDAEFNIYNSQRSANCDETITEDSAFNALIDGKPNHLEQVQILNVDLTAEAAFACYSADSYVSTPQMASDSPSDIAGDVMSLYSDYYAPEVAGAVNNMEVITWDASWGQLTQVKLIWAETGKILHVILYWN